jgi:hypothetical protein
LRSGPFEGPAIVKPPALPGDTYYEIVDCGVFCEVIFFFISPMNLLGDFFDSLSLLLRFIVSRKSPLVGVFVTETPTFSATLAFPSLALISKMS